MATVEIIIPAFRFAALNAYLGKHWSVGHKLKKRDKAMVMAYSMGKPKATDKRRVDLHVTLEGRQKAADPDALLKSCFDALVHAGMLKDDTCELVAIGSITYGRGKSETRITLTDI